MFGFYFLQVDIMYQSTVIDSSVSISTTITTAYTDPKTMMNGDNSNMLRVTNIN